MASKRTDANYEALEFLLGIVQFVVSEALEALQYVRDAVFTVHLVVTSTNVHRRVLLLLLTYH